MKKFWTYFKKAIFVWGITSLVIALFLTILLARLWWVSHKAGEQEQDVKYEKTLNDIKLSVIRKNDQTNRFLVSVTKADKPLITDYLLPVKQYDLDYLTIKDVSIIPVSENEYRIVLYSTLYECDQELANYIWLLKLKEHMKLVQMIQMSDTHRIEGSEIIIFGNKIIDLPAAADFGYEKIVIPIEIKIGHSIKMTPMLGRKSMDMMKSYFKREILKRKDKLAGSPDTATKELYEKALREFDETISERVIPY
jgi:hypothetical protein